jgi:hypothetical protein
MAASDYVHYLQKTSCVFWGVHRWEAGVASYPFVIPDLIRDPAF